MLENIKSTSDEGTDDNRGYHKGNSAILLQNKRTDCKQTGWSLKEKAAEAETKNSSDASDSALDTIELTDSEKKIN